MATQIGELTVKVKLVGVGGKRRLRFLALVTKLLGIKLDAKEDV